MTVTTAGAAPSPTFVAEMEALGARVIHVYGLTEIYGPYSTCDWQPDWHDARRSGASATSSHGKASAWSPRSGSAWSIRT